MSKVKAMKMSQIVKDIESMSAEDITALMSSIKEKNVRRIDTTKRARRNAITELYFNCAPPLTTEWDINTHRDHCDCIREQVLSGVDL